MKFIRYILFILLILISHFSSAQKIGLVLSGGGAKGLTHIGVIRALEENNIPIESLVSNGYGFSRPLVPNNSEENRAVNRRVEFKILNVDNAQ